MRDHLSADFDASPATVSEAVAAATESWGGIWQPDATGGRLTLPIVQGLRHGVVHGRIAITPNGVRTHLDLAIEEASYRLNRSATFVLVLGALGGLSVVLWPLSPKILQLAPVGVVLALAAWLLVVSRLRNSGADDFLELVADLAAAS